MRLERMIAAVTRATVNVVVREIETAGQFVRAIGLQLAHMRKLLWEMPAPATVLVVDSRDRSMHRCSDRYCGTATKRGCKRGSWLHQPSGLQQAARARFASV